MPRRKTLEQFLSRHRAPCQQVASYFIATPEEVGLSANAGTALAGSRAISTPASTTNDSGRPNWPRVQWWATRCGGTLQSLTAPQVGGRYARTTTGLSSSRRHRVLGVERSLGPAASIASIASTAGYGLDTRGNREYPHSKRDHLKARHICLPQERAERKPAELRRGVLLQLGKDADQLRPLQRGASATGRIDRV